MSTLPSDIFAAAQNTLERHAPSPESKAFNAVRQPKCSATWHYFCQYMRFSDLLLVAYEVTCDSPKCPMFCFSNVSYNDLVTLIFSFVVNDYTL